MVCTDLTQPSVISRTIAQDILGRNILVKTCNQKRIGFVHSLYPNRAMEWINIRQICMEALVHYGYDELIPSLENIMFGWRYHEQFCSMVYQPAKVFRDFCFDETTFCSPCPCNAVKRFSKFLDPTTTGTSSSAQIPSITNSHVRTMDTAIIRDRSLKENFISGLNHIPLRQTLLHEVVETVTDAWIQVCWILQIEPDEPIVWVRNRAWNILKEKASINVGGFKYSQASFKKVHSAIDELKWIQKFLFIAGLDKASSNASFICINHIRAQALLRLQGKDFSPCLHNGKWIDPMAKADKLIR